ncbi:hypothetical protein [Massilia sp. 9I]|uniref:hypothetical protein n=1 Tax=Massilia sp. 9I TaxID=2653152 RepID=UPI0012F0A4B5|nr:hypothetical protein [Massilia sp. 9I]VXB43377.1 hypothetical protein MASSI9I_20737 [Massilia sp. 9I]
MQATRWILLGAVLVLGTGAAGPEERHFAPSGLFELQAAVDLGMRNPDGGAVLQKPKLLCAKIPQQQGLPKNMRDSGCTDVPGVMQGDRVVFDSACPWGRAHFAVRQVDAQTWESTLEEERLPLAGGAGLRADPELRRMMADVGRHGDPDEREAARRTLAEMEAKEQGAGRAPIRTRVVVRMKRLAPDCT